MTQGFDELGFFFQELERICNEPQFRPATNAVYRIGLTPRGSFYITCTGESVSVDERPLDCPDGADCAMTALEGEFLKLAKGKLNNPLALARSSLKLTGARHLLRYLLPALQEVSKITTGKGGDRARAQSMSAPQSPATPVQNEEKQNPYLTSLPDLWRVFIPRDRWAADSAVTKCTRCEREFTLVRRRHHCRICGRIFCGQCSKHRVLGARACDECDDAAVNNPELFTKDVPSGLAPVTPVNAASRASTSTIAGTATTPGGIRPLNQSDGEEDDDDDDNVDTTGAYSTAATTSSLPFTASILGASVDAVLSGFRDKAVEAWFINGDGHDVVERSVPTTARGDGGTGRKGSSTGSSDAAAGSNELAPRTVGMITLAMYALVLGLLGGPSLAWNTTPIVFTLLTILVLSILYTTNNALLRRRLRVYYVAGAIFLTFQWVKRTAPYMTRTREEEDALWNSAHERLSKMALHNILTLQGFWIKIGQYLSTRSDVLTRHWVSALEQLQDEIPARPFSDVERTVTEDLGRIHDIFSEFAESPIAAASIGQVHKARLRSGQDVVVKVRHPNIKSILLQDLHNLSVIMSWVSYFEPDFDFAPVVDEWTKEAVKELDFRHESENMQAVQRNMKAAQIDVIIPDVIEGMVTERVLCMTFIDGFKVTDIEELDRYGIDRLSLLHRITQAYANQIYVDGFFNGDPHPGNILVNVSNGKVTPVLLDFGLTKRLEPRMKTAFANLVIAANDLNSGAMLQAFDQMGLVMNRSNPTGDMDKIRFMLRDTKPPEESREEFKAEMRKRIAEYDNQTSAERNPIEAWPAELVFFFRVTLLLRGLCSSLSVRLPYMQVLAPYARKSIINTVPLSQHCRTNLHPVPRVLSPLHSRVNEYVYQLRPLLDVLGLQVCVYREGTKIVDIAAGVQGNSDPRPVTPETMFCIFSATKPLTAAVLLTALDAHPTYTLDTPICHVWPMFARHGKGLVTIRHALCHQTGIAGSVGFHMQIDDLVEYDEMIDTVALAKPDETMGKSSKYHYLSYGWVMAGILRGILSDLPSPLGSLQPGQDTVADVLRACITQPLGIDSECYLGFADSEYEKCVQRIASLSNGFGANGQTPTAEDMDMMAQAASSNGPPSTNNGSDNTDTEGIQGKEDGGDAADSSDSRDSRSGSGAAHTPNLLMLDPCTYNADKMRKAQIPAANGHLSARALAKVYAVLADGGRDGERQVIPAFVPRAMAERHGSDDTGSELGAAGETTWGLGVHLYAFTQGGEIIGRAFGHSGLGGSFGFCDPDRRIAVGVTVNRLTLARGVVNDIIDIICQELGLGHLIDAPQ